MYSKSYCSYHYVLSVRGIDIENAPIRNKAEAGESVKFLERISKSDIKGCVLWKFGKDSRGYGAVYYRGKRLKAHRAMLMIVTGENPPSTVFACHTCDKPLCINPKHLYWGDAKSNARDRRLETSTVKE